MSHLIQLRGPLAATCIALMVTSTSSYADEVVAKIGVAGYGKPVRSSR